MVRRPLGESLKGGRAEKRQVLVRLSLKGYLKGGADGKQNLASYSPGTIGVFHPSKLGDFGEPAQLPRK